MPETVRDCQIGCCGWREAKAKYFAQFPVVELQDTFYEPPTPALAAKWKALAPPGFVYCLKAWQLITHTPSSPTYRRLKSKISPEEHDLLGSFRQTEQVWLAWERTRTLARVLEARVVVFQCPASFRPTRENLDNFRWFFGQMEPETWKLAFEPRGPAWPLELARELCAEFGLIHCVDPFVSGPVYGETVYWRLHGGKGYKAKYTDEQLAELHAWAEAAAGPAYVMFNNVWMRDDARRFQALLAGGAGDRDSLKA